MDLKKRLILNYLALLVGFTALFIVSFISKQRGLRMFPQQAGLPQGPVRLVATAGINEVSGQKVVGISLKLRNLTQHEVRVVGSRFELVATNGSGKMLEIVNKPSLPAGTITANQGRKSYVFDLFFMSGLTIPAGGTETNWLPTINFALGTDNSYKFVVNHGRADSNGGFINVVDMMEGNEAKEYDILSGLSGDLIIQSSTPTLTPIPPVSPSPPPTITIPPTIIPSPPIKRGTTLSLIKESDKVISNQRRTVDIEVRLVTNNVKVDSVDLVLSYPQDVSFHPIIFAPGMGLGRSAQVVKKSLDKSRRVALVSITNIHLTKSLGKKYYDIGTFPIYFDPHSREVKTFQLVYKVGSTTDTNVNVRGEDILSGVGQPLVIQPLSPSPTIAPTPTSVPSPTPIPTPTIEPTPTVSQPISIAPVLFSFDVQTGVMHKVENKSASSSDYETLPALVWLVNNRGELAPLWWTSPVFNGHTPVVWFSYSSNTEGKLVNFDQQEVNISSTDVKGMSGVIIKVAGFLAKRVTLNRDTLSCSRNNAGQDICRVKVGTLLPGDNNKAGNSDYITKYKQLLKWNNYAPQNEGSYLTALLKWFGDDYINAFDMGMYPTILGDANYNLDWFEGKASHKYIPLPQLQRGTAVDMTRNFNLLDLDGNRYLNALDWSLVNNSFSTTSGKGALFSFLQGVH